MDGLQDYCGGLIAEKLEFEPGIVPGIMALGWLHYEQPVNSAIVLLTIH